MPLLLKHIVAGVPLAWHGRDSWKQTVEDIAIVERLRTIFKEQRFERHGDHVVVSLVVRPCIYIYIYIYIYLCVCVLCSLAALSLPLA
jgi:hypothetical protein